MVYPFEKAAMNADEMPEGLSAADQFMFLALRNLYKSKRLGLIDRDQGSREKNKLEAVYRQLSFDQKHLDASAKLWKRIEGAAKTVSENGELMAIDAVKNLLNTIYGGKLYG